jgi:hypothetical protein
MPNLQTCSPDETELERACLKKIVEERSRHGSNGPGWIYFHQHVFPNLRGSIGQACPQLSRTLKFPVYHPLNRPIRRITTLRDHTESTSISITAQRM